VASYDLRCRTCGNEFEVFVLGFLKEQDKVCPQCGGREVEQRLTGFGGVTGLSSYPSCADGGRCEPRGCTPRAGFS
jgi:putative FmdB family regulatory protein